MRDKLIALLPAFCLLLLVLAMLFCFGERIARSGEEQKPSVRVGTPSTGIEIPADREQTVVQVYLSVCGAGGSAAGGSWSGSVVTGESRVCEILRVSAALDAMGDDWEAHELLLSAKDLVDPTKTSAQRASLLIRDWVLDPVFNLIPWVGSAAY